MTGTTPSMDAIDTPNTVQPGADAPDPIESKPRDRVLSWSVHLFTSMGAVLALLSLLAIMGERLDRAVIYMLLALVIDSVDGTLARKVGVTIHVPQIDGRRLDDMVDYLNFVIVPAVFMVQAGSVLSPWVVACPVLASAIGFSRNDAKTDDDFFLGFPSYWNILAFYLWLLDYGPMTGTLWVVGLSIAVFVPYKYIYPSKLQNQFLRYFTSYSGLLWSIVLAFAVLAPETAHRYHIVGWSLLYPALYMGLSFWLGGLQRKPAS
jgi:phosphatidylcholine synthase